MRGLTRFVVFFSIFAIVSVTSKAQTLPSFLLPIKKHEPTKRFYTSLDVGIPRRSSLNLVLDLDSSLTWLDCHRLNSSTLRKIPCRSSACSAVPGDGCDGGFCSRRQSSPLSGKPVAGRISQERISFHKTDGARVAIRGFTFLCAADPGVAPPVAGVLGLAGSSISLRAQVTSAFNVIPKFALCLPSKGTGRFYIAGAPYNFPPLTESPTMTMTPLANPGSNPGGYFISVKSVSVDGNAIAIDERLLSGGTKISTVAPYTVLHSDIYKALALTFTNRAKAKGILKAAAVAPFSDCYAAAAVTNFPAVDVAVPGRAGDMKWSFHGENTVVKVSDKVICLAFVDGGTKPKNAIVIGTHQLQNYLLEFDLSTSRFAFSDSLLLQKTSCSL